MECTHRRGGFANMKRKHQLGESVMHKDHVSVPNATSDTSQSNTSSKLSRRPSVLCSILLNKGSTLQLLLSKVHPNVFMLFTCNSRSLRNRSWFLPVDLQYLPVCKFILMSRSEPSLHYPWQRSVNHTNLYQLEVSYF